MRWGCEVVMNEQEGHHFFCFWLKCYVQTEHLIALSA
jgi:hypothetical protein